MAAERIHGDVRRQWEHELAQAAADSRAGSDQLGHWESAVRQRLAANLCP